MKFCILILFFYLFQNSFSTNVKCHVKFEFKRQCQELRDFEKCFSGQLEFCEVVKTTYQKKHCPQYQCFYVTDKKNDSIVSGVKTTKTLDKNNHTNSNSVRFSLNLNTTKLNSSFDFSFQASTRHSPNSNQSISTQTNSSQLNLTASNASTETKANSTETKTNSTELNVKGPHSHISQAEFDSLIYSNFSEIFKNLNKTFESFFYQINLEKLKDNYFWSKLKESKFIVKQLKAENSKSKKKIRKLKRRLKKTKTRMASINCGDKSCVLSYEEREEVITDRG